MKTALQQLDEIIGTNPKMIPTSFIKRKIELLLEVEKNQIMEALKCGNLSFGYGFDAEKYYNDTYKNNL